MGSGSEVYNQVRLSRTKASHLQSDIYNTPATCSELLIIFLLDNQLAKLTVRTIASSYIVLHCVVNRARA